LISGMFKYSHLSAKIRAMRGKMLTKKDFEDMIVKNNVKDIALFLKNHTYYSDGLQDLDENDVHRGHIEVLLYRAEISDALKIARYIKGDHKKIYRFFYRKQEIEDLKKMLRTLLTGKGLKSIDRKRLFISKYSVIDFNKALETTTIQELIDTIKHTNFYPILKPLIKGENDIDLFAAEMALDMYYYTKLFEGLEKYVSGKDKEAFRFLFGIEADIKNIILIYRGKKYYSTGKEKIYPYLIPAHYKLKKDQIDKMINAKNAEEVIKIVNSTYYGNILSDSVSDWEDNCREYILRTQEKNMRLFPFTIAPIIAYIFEKEMEIHNITTVIEGVRYSLNPEDIKKRLIGFAN